MTAMIASIDLQDYLNLKQERNELLMALEALEAEYRSLRDKDGYKVAQSTALSKARDAIARATGREAA